MTTKAPAIVRGRDGLLGTIIDRESESSGVAEATVDVLLDDGRRLLVPSEFLKLRPDGGYDLALSAGEIGRLSGADRAEAESDRVVVPIVAEEAEIGKRRVESGRVRVRKTVRSTEQVVDEPVVREEVEVERVPINRVLDEPIGPRQEGDTLIVPLLEEVLVIEKRLMLREEVRITRRRVEQRSSQTITLRSEQATIERIEGEDRPDSRGIDTSDG